MRNRSPVAASVAFLAGLSSHAFAQVAAGPEFQVHAYLSSAPLSPRIAATPGGDAIVVWTGQTDGDGDGVFARWIGAQGVFLGPEFQVNSYTTGRQRLASVTVARRHDFVVSWAGPQAGDSDGIVVRRMRGGGVPVGSDFLVNTYVTGLQSSPRLAGAEDGSFVVAWEGPTDGDAGGITARRVGADGVPIGAPFLVNSYTTGNQWRPDIGRTIDGGFVVVWEETAYRDGSFAGIFGRRFVPSGAPIGEDFLVNSYTTGWQSNPSISVAGSGGFVVSWEGPGDGSLSARFARRFDAAGNALGADFVVNSYTTNNQVNGSVAHDAAGNFVVTWQGPGANDPDWGVYGQRFAADGTRRGGEFRAHATTSDWQRFPVVASDSVGNFVVVWQSGYTIASRPVMARRFGWLRPSALAVVDGGNGVLEVPDNFGLTTSWQNISGAPRTFQGQASEFTGPAGLVYTLGSTTADYGTVADGATAPCSGTCFSGALLGVRPTGHVDVSIRERIVPDTLGQDYRWILHVGKSFDDVPPSNGFYRFVETLLHRGVTGGCAATTYCPGAATTREQMAVFVLVAKEGAGYVPPPCGATPMFADVPFSSPFCRWVEELARRGVVGGCGGGNYCPTAAVSRDQMSVFVLRTLDPALAPPACSPPNLFADLPETSPFCRWVEELARRGIVTGCGGGNYCPSAAVTREQMGVFIGATFGLTLYGP